MINLQGVLCFLVCFFLEIRSSRVEPSLRSGVLYLEGLPMDLNVLNGGEGDACVHQLPL